MFRSALRTTLAAAVALAFAQGVPALAQDEHKHDAQPAKPAQPGTQDHAQNGMMGMMQTMQMMHGGMPHMRMMGDAGTGGMMMGGPIRHVEGHIAFLKTELKITDAQKAAWDAFADTLRANSKRMNHMQTMMGASGTRTLATRLEAHEKAITARLETIKATRNALAKLVAVLSDDQKKKLEELTTARSPMGH
jgi:hypothetical protein